MTAPPIFPLESVLGSLAYPPPLGSAWPFTKKRSKSTGTFISSSGIRTDVMRRVATLWNFAIDFGALSSADGQQSQGIAPNSLQTVLGFFEDLMGAYGTFLFLDPSDCTIANQIIGTGNGTNHDFVITRTLGTRFGEPVGWVNVGDVTQVTVNGSPITGFSITAPNILHLASAAPNTQPVAITVAKWYFQCKAPDDIEMVEDQSTFWTAQKIEFSSIVPNYPSLTLLP